MKRFSIIIAAMLISGGCAMSNARHIATVSVATAHPILSTMQDTEMLLVCGRSTAPAPPACIPISEHNTISKHFVTAFDAEIEVAKTIRDWPVSTPIPTTVAGKLAQITTIINYIIDHIPASALKTKLLVTIGGKL